MIIIFAKYFYLSAIQNCFSFKTETTHIQNLRLTFKVYTTADTKLIHGHAQSITFKLAKLTESCRLEPLPFPPPPQVPLSLFCGNNILCQSVLKKQKSIPTQSDNSTISLTRKGRERGNYMGNPIPVLLF